MSVKLMSKFHKHTFIGCGDIKSFVNVWTGVDQKYIPQNGLFQKWTFLVS